MVQLYNREPLKRPLPSGHVPGQLIVRFKQQVVEHLASSPVSRSASLRTVAASMPDNVSGPLDFLKKEGGMRVRAAAVRGYESRSQGAAPG